MTGEGDKANKKHPDILALMGSGGFMSRVGFFFFEDILRIKCYYLSFREPPSVKNLLWVRKYGLGSSSWLGWGLKPPPEKQEDISVGLGGRAVRVW